MSDVDRGKEEEKESLSRLVHSPILHHWSCGSMVFPSALLSSWLSFAVGVQLMLGHYLLMICDLWFMIHHLWDSWLRCSCIKCMCPVRLICVGHMTAGEIEWQFTGIYSHLEYFNFRLSCECKFWGWYSVLIRFIDQKAARSHTTRGDSSNQSPLFNLAQIIKSGVFKLYEIMDLGFIKAVVHIFGG